MSTDDKKTDDSQKKPAVGGVKIARIQAPSNIRIVPVRSEKRAAAAKAANTVFDKPKSDPIEQFKKIAPPQPERTRLSRLGKMGVALVGLVAASVVLMVPWQRTEPVDATAAEGNNDVVSLSPEYLFDEPEEAEVIVAETFAPQRSLVPAPKPVIEPVVAEVVEPEPVVPVQQVSTPDIEATIAEAIAFEEPPIEPEEVLEVEPVVAVVEEVIEPISQIEALPTTELVETVLSNTQPPAEEPVEEASVDIASIEPETPEDSADWQKGIVDQMVLGTLSALRGAPSDAEMASIVNLVTVARAQGLEDRDIGLILENAFAANEIDVPSSFIRADGTLNTAAIFAQVNG